MVSQPEPVRSMYAQRVGESTAKCVSVMPLGETLMCCACLPAEAVKKTGWRWAQAARSLDRLGKSFMLGGGLW